MPKKHYTQLIKNEAHRLGFLKCGISKADFLEEEAPRLEKWLKNKLHGEMMYMENYFDKRLDPRLILDDAKSVISLSYNYYTTDSQESPNTFKISKYAYGEDYHKVIKHKGRELLQFISREVGEVNARLFIDSAPLLEKAWAKSSGLGWVGKHSNLISKKIGSFFFLAEIVIDLDLEYDTMATDHCGNCTKCIDACPTEAIIKPYEIDSNKCISYLTIEYKKEIPEEFSQKMEGFIFGCDICQDVCPWNRFSTPHKEPRFKPHPDLLSMTRDDWESITEYTFKKLFKNSAVNRTGYSGLSRNINFLIRK